VTIHETSNPVAEEVTALEEVVAELVEVALWEVLVEVMVMVMLILVEVVAETELLALVDVPVAVPEADDAVVVVEDGSKQPPAMMAAFGGRDHVT